MALPRCPSPTLPASPTRFHRNSVVQYLSEGDSYSWVKKNHTLTFGGDFKRQDRNTTTDQNARGTFQFSGIATSAFNANGQPIPNTGFDFADFLLGLPQSSSVQFGGDSEYFRQNAWDAYANDDWRVNPNLTLDVRPALRILFAALGEIRAPGESRYRARLYRGRSGFAGRRRALFRRISEQLDRTGSRQFRSAWRAWPGSRARSIPQWCAWATAFTTIQPRSIVWPRNFPSSLPSPKRRP